MWGRGRQQLGEPCGSQPAGGLLTPPWAQARGSLEHKAPFIYGGVGASLCLDSCCYHSRPSWNACPHLLGTEDSEQIKQLVKISWQPAQSSGDQGNLGRVRCPRWSWTEQCLWRKPGAMWPWGGQPGCFGAPLQRHPWGGNRACPHKRCKCRRKGPPCPGQVVENTQETVCRKLGLPDLGANRRRGRNGPVSAP